jgi:hypothetical protein
MSRNTIATAITIVISKVAIIFLVFIIKSLFYGQEALPGIMLTLIRYFLDALFCF